MVEPKTFHVGDVLSVITGVLVGPSGIGGVYEVVDHMEGRPHWTHELPDGSRRLQAAIVKQVPELAEVKPPEFTLGDKGAVDAWVASVCEYIGKTHVVLAPVSVSPSS